MQMRNRFVVQDFQLKINHAAYLVEVSPIKKDHNGDDLSSLPGWVFHSKHAIWLIRGSMPLVDRALEGERIKKTLMRKLSSRICRLKKEDSKMLLHGAMKLIALDSVS